MRCDTVTSAQWMIFRVLFYDMLWCEKNKLRTVAFVEINKEMKNKTLKNKTQFCDIKSRIVWINIDDWFTYNVNTQIY